MSKNLYHNCCTIIIFTIITLMLSSCEGPTGQPGNDASETCKICHNSSTLIFSKKSQWYVSKHASGENVDKNDTNCAACHTSEGFREALISGSYKTHSMISNPSPINCRTCHLIHTNNDYSDFNFSCQSPVKLVITGEIVDYGKGNICARCHQARVVSIMPQPNGDSIMIPTPYWGPHQSTAANILAGTGGINIPGTEPYLNSIHIGTNNPNACIACHMAESKGIKMGGHTLVMGSCDNDSTNKIKQCQNLAGCLNCHPGATNFGLGLEIRSEIKNYLLNLRSILASKNMLDTTNSKGDYKNDLIIPRKYSGKEASVLYNYKFCVAEGSIGVHNTKYTRALLKNTISAIK